MKLNTGFRICCALTLIAYGAISSARAQQLVEQIDDVVGKILNHEECQGAAGIVVGGFQLSVPQQDLNAAAMIKQHIVDCLRKRNIKIEKRGQFPAISGQYCYATPKSPVVDIELYLNGRQGKQAATYPVRVEFSKDAHEVINIAAPSTVKFVTSDTGYDRGQTVVKALKAPQVSLHDNCWASAPGGQYAIALACQSNGTYQPVPVHSDGGFAYCQLKMGQSYRILLKNNTSHDAMAAVAIDGLDVFTFASQKSDGYLVRPGREEEIKGWFISDRMADSFVVGKFAETPAAEILGDAADAGVICVQFSAAWLPGHKPPDEGGTLSSDVGTKRGETVGQNVTREARQIGKVREVVCIRYGVNPP